MLSLGKIGSQINRRTGLRELHRLTVVHLQEQVPCPARSCGKVPVTGYDNIISFNIFHACLSEVPGTAYPSYHKFICYRVGFGLSRKDCNVNLIYAILIIYAKGDWARISARNNLSDYHALCYRGNFQLNITHKYMIKCNVVRKVGCKNHQMITNSKNGSWNPCNLRRF